MRTKRHHRWAKTETDRSWTTRPQCLADNVLSNLHTGWRGRSRVSVSWNDCWRRV